MRSAAHISSGANQPRLLDVCCCAGGCSMGYWRAGFDITGVDIDPQPNYPFKFIQADALTLDYEFLMSFDVIHASPPCQAYSRASHTARKKHGKEYPDLFVPVKRMLVAAGLPYIMENVLGSPAKGVRLYGDQFRLGVLRERIFESNIPLVCDLPRQKVGSVKTGEYVTVAGKKQNSSRWAEAMGIDWAATHEIREAIPPAFTEYLGLQVRAWLHEHRGLAPVPHFIPDEKRCGLAVWERENEYQAIMSSQVSHFDPSALQQLGF